VDISAQCEFQGTVQADERFGCIATFLMLNLNVIPDSWCAAD